MNKTELVEAIAKKADLSKKDAEAALKAFTETVGAQLKKGDKIVALTLKRSDPRDMTLQLWLSFQIPKTMQEYLRLLRDRFL